MSDAWLSALVDGICECLISDVKGRMSPLSYRVSAPDDNGIGTWLIHIAPTNGEVVGGQDDGEEIFDPIDADLLGLGGVLDETETFIYDPGGHDEDPHFWLSGIKEGNEVTVQIYLHPFDDTKPSWSFDTNRGGWKIPDDEGDES